MCEGRNLDKLVISPSFDAKVAALLFLQAPDKVISNDFYALEKSKIDDGDVMIIPNFFLFLLQFKFLFSTSI